jgi:hypothetical protein
LGITKKCGITKKKRGVKMSEIKEQCPYCGGYDMENENCEFYADEILLKVRCQNSECSKAWYEVFYHARAEEIGSGKGL